MSVITESIYFSPQISKRGHVFGKLQYFTGYGHLTRLFIPKQQNTQYLQDRNYKELNFKRKVIHITTSVVKFTYIV